MGLPTRLRRARVTLFMSSKTMPWIPTERADKTFSDLSSRNIAFRGSVFVSKQCQTTKDRQEFSLFTMKNVSIEPEIGLPFTRGTRSKHPVEDVPLSAFLPKCGIVG